MAPNDIPFQRQGFLFETLQEQCDPKDPLMILAQKMDWQKMHQTLVIYYKDGGRPAHPIRLMVGLMILKQLYNLSDKE